MEKTIIWGEVGSSGKRRQPNMRWMDSITEAIGISLQEGSRAVKDRLLWTSLIRRVAKYWS